MSLDSTDGILGQEFLTWLWFQSETGNNNFRDSAGNDFAIYIEQRLVVQSGDGQSLETTTVSASPLSALSEAKTGLGTGKKVSRALIRLEQNGLTFYFTLKAEDFSITSLKTPKVDKSDVDDEPDALLLEKVFLIERSLDMLDSLFKLFVNLRLSEKWQNETQAIGDWLQSDMEA